MPVATATTTCDGFKNGIEDFTYADFSHPAPTCLYTNNTNGGYVQPTIGGHDKVFYSGGSSNAGFLIAGASPCAVVNSGIPITVEADLYFTASAGAGDIKGLSWGDTSAGGTSANLGINAGTNTPYLTGHVSGTTDQAALPGAPALSLNTWYHFKLTVQDTGATSSCNSLVITGQVTVGASTYGRITTATLAGTDIGTGTTNGGLVRPGTYNAGAGTFSSSADLYVDNLQVSGYPETVGAAGAWCPNLNSANFGYTYKSSGVSFDDSIPDQEVTELESGFVYVGNDPLDAVVAKGMDPTGTKALHVNSTIEADDDGVSSIFRLTAATVSNTPSGTSVGNGFSSNNFASSLQANWEESGDHWQLKFYKVITGTRTQVGSAVNVGNPDSADPYTFWVDSRPDAFGPPDSAYPGGGAAIQSGPYMAVTVPDDFIDNAFGEPNSIILYKNLNAEGVTAFNGLEFYNVWQTGESTSVVVATTYLDNNEEGSHDSSCIFDDVGTAVYEGDPGTLPESFLPDEPGEEAVEDCSAIFCPPADGIGGLSSGALSLFLGIVIVGAFAASMSQDTGTGAGGLAIFAVLGVFIAYALGYIQLWVVLVLFTIGLGAIFLGFSNGGKAKDGM